MTIEKEQARALSEAINELLDDLANRNSAAQTPQEVDLMKLNMDLREPIDAEFRVAQMGLGYDPERDLVVIVAQEMVLLDEEQDPDLAQPGVVRLWASRQQMRALSAYTREVVRRGRVDPQSNGRLLYYWT